MTGGERVRRGFEHREVLGVAELQHFLEVIGERPHASLAHEVDGGGCDYLVVVVDETRQRLFHAAHPGLEENVAFADSLVERYFVDERKNELNRRPYWTPYWIYLKEWVVECLNSITWM